MFKEKLWAVTVALDVLTIGIIIVITIVHIHIYVKMNIMTMIGIIMMIIGIKDPNESRVSRELENMNMFYVSKELIEEELKRDKDIGFGFSYQKLSNKFINRLFNHYYIEELCEFFYDSEPDFDDEEFNMYMDYQNSHKLTGLTFWNLVSNMEEIEEKKENFKYSKQPHTQKELKAAHDKVVQMYKDYEQTRIECNNWIEPYFNGNWDMSQKYVDSFGRDVLIRIRNFPKSIKNRLYVACKDEQIRIYFYGRDFWEVDYWYVFKKRKRRLK